jgi:hypothetical protein
MVRSPYRENFRACHTTPEFCRRHNMSRDGSLFDRSSLPRVTLPLCAVADWQRQDKASHRLMNRRYQQVASELISASAREYRQQRSTASDGLRAALGAISGCGVSMKISNQVDVVAGSFAIATNDGAFIHPV